MPTEPEARAKEKRRKARKARKAGESARKRKRRLRKNIPIVVEQKTVTAEQLPEGYTLDDFRKLGVPGRGNPIALEVTRTAGAIRGWHSPIAEAVNEPLTPSGNSGALGRPRAVAGALPP